MKDYYAILGVSPSANADEIKRAYRRLAVVYHPDKNPDPQAEVLFKEINEAYDVLGDPEKRLLYNQRLQNPFLEILQEEPQPRHRDPRYRPRTHHPRKPGVYDLMKEYLPYIQWISYAGLLVTCVLAIDYFLPYKFVDDRVVDYYVVKGRRGTMYFVLITEAHGKLKVYNYEPWYFDNAPAIRIQTTMIYSTVMGISSPDGTQFARLGYLYRALILFPLILFITSLLGVIFRKRVEFPFNLNIVSGILLIITLSLIF